MRQIAPSLLAVMLTLVVVCSCDSQKTSDSNSDQDSTETEFSETKELTFSTITHEEKRYIWTYKFTGEYPTGGNEQLVRSIQKWINQQMGGTYEGELSDTTAMFQHYADKLLDDTDLDMLRQMTEDSIECCMEYEFHPVWQSDSLITYTMTSYWYGGGAHGGTVVLGTTMRKSDGYQYGWDMLKSDADLTHEIHSGLKKYFEVKSEEALYEQLILTDDWETPTSTEIPLPDSAPWIEADGMHLIYQQYEIACYAAGMPALTIPWKRLGKYCDLPGVK